MLTRHTKYQYLWGFEHNQSHFTLYEIPEIRDHRVDKFGRWMARCSQCWSLCRHEICRARSIPHLKRMLNIYLTLSGLAETLHLEISPLGLRSICFEPGYFRTDFLQDGHRQPYNPRIEDYNEMTKQAHEALEGTLFSKT